MEIVTLQELKDSYIELQKQRESSSNNKQVHMATEKGKTALKCYLLQVVYKRVRLSYFGQVEGTSRGRQKSF